MFQNIKEKLGWVKTPAAEENSTYQTIDPEIYKEYNAYRPQGPQKLFCYVPFNNMSFSFSGRTLACSYNQKVELGRYPQNSVRDMWFGEAGEKLRDHMTHNDLEEGCKHCKYFFNNRKFSGIKPLVFDKYAADFKRNQYPQVLEFELSNTCNLECIMCNGFVSSSIRKNKDKLPPIKSVYDDAFVNQLDEFIPHLKEAKFYGGEPFLIPMYHKIWNKMLDVNPGIKYFVITNGTVKLDIVKSFVERGDFDVAVSMDAVDKSLLESIRLNTVQEQVFETIEYLRDYCKRNNKNLTVSYTCMRKNWMEFPKMVEFANEKDIHLYISYLKTPPYLALWNLPADELKEIREELEKHSFPGGDWLREHNKRCYTDFLRYLKNCEETNRKEEAEELKAGGVPSKKVLGAQIEENNKDAEINNAVENNAPHNAIDHKAVFKLRLSEYIESTNYFNAEQQIQKSEQLVNKFFGVLNGIDDKVDTTAVLKIINQATIQEVVESIESMPEDVLQEELLKIG